MGLLIDHQDMLLAILVSIGSFGLLIAIGRLTDAVVSDQATQWAQRVGGSKPLQRTAQPAAFDQGE